MPPNPSRYFDAADPVADRASDSLLDGVGNRYLAIALVALVGIYLLVTVALLQILYFIVRPLRMLLPRRSARGRSLRVPSPPRD